MGLEKIIGQALVVEALNSGLKRDRIGNAYLFHGPEGCGKKTIAGLFAQGMNCLSHEKKPCGVCSACLKFAHGNHPNIEWVRPDGASIKIKQIVQIVSDTAKKPYEQGYKVVIIDMADKMTVDAQNAFLKTLEEPPSATVFLLLAENPGNLLTTIVSRCQTMRMRPVDKREIESWLQSTFPGRGDQIKLATAFSNGIIGRAVQMLEKPEYFEKRKLYGRYLMALFSGQSTLSGDQDFYLNRAEAEAFTEFALTVVRDIMLLVELGEAYKHELYNQDLLELIEKGASRLGTRKLLKLTEIIAQTGEYLKRNVNIKGCMDALLINILEVTHG